MTSAKANLTKFTQMLQTGGNGRAATITSLATPAKKPENRSNSIAGLRSHSVSPIRHRQASVGHEMRSQPLQPLETCKTTVQSERKPEEMKTGLDKKI